MSYGDAITWSCECCGETVTDNDLQVTKHKITETATRNVRHCGRPVCKEAASIRERWVPGPRLTTEEKERMG